MPVMGKLGLSNIRPIEGVAQATEPMAYFGLMQEASSGKDTMTGHWEMMGLRIDTPFRVFEHGFPDELIARIQEHTGRKVIGNKPASGTEIIDELGEEHVRTGALIVYTSADSVLQIAAHEEIVPLPELYSICEFCREITLDDPYMLGRIIARPFIGEQGAFRRTAGRHDYALKPFQPTVMNTLKDAGLDVVAIGKISDIFDGEGVTRSIRTASNMEGMDRLVEVCGEDFTGISFLNLVDFDDSMVIAAIHRDMGKRWSSSMPGCRKFWISSERMICSLLRPTTAMTLRIQVPTIRENSCLCLFIRRVSRDPANNCRCE